MEATHTGSKGAVMIEKLEYRPCLLGIHRASLR
jgi:hypothetical protein